MSARTWLAAVLERRLSAAQLDWLASAVRGVAERASKEPGFLPTQISLASRHVPRGALAPSELERESAAQFLPGFDPERWSVLDAARARLLLAELPDAVLEQGLEECFRFADVGELVALYRSLALLPAPERFAWRAKEGCRSSMRVVFEAVACDSPLPARIFDDVAWRQLVIKALFVEAPLWRVHGLDSRIDAELARMALDLADERRSAGRAVRHELWLTLGRCGGERGRAALERELESGAPTARRAAAIGLARAQELDTLRRRRETERDPLVRATMDAALAGRTDAASFRELEPQSQTP